MSAQQFNVDVGGGQVLGPFGASQLKQMARSGMIRPSTRIEVVGRGWVAAKAIKGLVEPVDQGASAAVQGSSAVTKTATKVPQGQSGSTVTSRSAAANHPIVRVKDFLRGFDLLTLLPLPIGIVGAGVLVIIAKEDLSKHMSDLGRWSLGVALIIVGVIVLSLMGRKVRAAFRGSVIDVANDLLIVPGAIGSVEIKLSEIQKTAHTSGWGISLLRGSPNNRGDGEHDRKGPRLSGLIVAGRFGSETVWCTSHAKMIELDAAIAVALKSLSR